MGAVAVMRAISLHDIQPDAAILESPFDRLLSTVCHRFEAMGIPSFPGAELIVSSSQGSEPHIAAPQRPKGRWGANE
ncbi:hypothetical protein IQ241_13505 [Romeria aff. gracilis LEGE 07310]|uniref:Uncharacterized protein n=1 Tax=Vasconcelosia minhoensis LEGE 07310 TaxID=915328 RepID=A0A8J7AFE0_9CYAN|nr:hypothetical protein [Romeria gracilis]MBE9078296.1 hypothetical protein [Romeria aff. gracilis LEGE 07310]